MLPPRYDHQANEGQKLGIRCLIAIKDQWDAARRIASGRPATGWLLCTTIKLPKNYNLKIKPIERLVPVSFTRYRASTPGLSTSWSVTALKGELVSRGASRLDAFSGYPVRT